MWFISLKTVHGRRQCNDCCYSYFSVSQDPHISFQCPAIKFSLIFKGVLQNVVQCIGINMRPVLMLVLKWFCLVCSNTSYQRLVKCKHLRSITLHICWIPASWLKPHKRPCELHGLFCTTDTCYFGCTVTHCKHASSRKNYNFWIDNSVHYWFLEPPAIPASCVPV
jgi:hypothetical protein